MNPENAAEAILDQVARKLTGWKPEDWPQGKVNGSIKTNG